MKNIKIWIFFFFSMMALSLNIKAQATQSNMGMFESDSKWREIVYDLKKGHPSPLVTVKTEGLLSSDKKFITSVRAMRELFQMVVAAHLWELDKKNKDALIQSKRYLLAWIKVYKPNFNPIDETNFDTLIKTYLIIKPQLSDAENEKVLSKFRYWCEGYFARMGKSTNDGIWTNNWQSHRVKLVTYFAVALDDQKLLDEAEVQFKKQINNNINREGVTLDFIQRDAIKYAIYDLLPLVQSAYLAKKEGRDWYSWKSENNSSLKKGVHWFIPYLDGSKNHLEFKRSRVDFDRIRMSAGMTGFSEVFNPHNAADLMFYSSKLDPELLDISNGLNKKNSFNMIFLKNDNK